MGTKHVFIFAWILVGLAFLEGSPIEAAPPLRQSPTLGGPIGSPRSAIQLPSQQRQSISVGFPTQQDPFGENQAQEVRPKPPVSNTPKTENQFKPPTKEPANQTKPVDDAFGERQAQPKLVPPKTDPSKEVPRIQPQSKQPADQATLPGDPFADPPTPNDPTRNKVVPDPPKSIVQPEAMPNSPEINPPTNSRADSNSGSPQIDPTNPIEAPRQPAEAARQPEQHIPPTVLTDRPAENQRQPLYNPSVAPTNRSAQPSRNTIPPTGRNRFRPSRMPSNVYQPPPQKQPLYKSDFDPIPGLNATPAPVPSNSAPVFGDRYTPPATHPSNLSGVVAPPAPTAEPALRSVYSGAKSVYSDSVAQTLDTGCTSCQSGCRSCNSGCPNFYLSIFGGYTGQRGLDGYSGSRQIDADAGGGFGIALGRRNGRNLRTEAEFSFRSNNLSEFLTSPVAEPDVAPVSGELNAYAGMANAYWEMINVPNRCFKPYVGVGVGFVGINAVIRDSMSRNLVPSSARTDTSFAYQWIGGVNYKAYRNLDLFAEYRMFNADTYRLDPSVPGLGDRYTFKTDNVFAGFVGSFRS